MLFAAERRTIVAKSLLCPSLRAGSTRTAWRRPTNIMVRITPRTTSTTKWERARHQEQDDPLVLVVRRQMRFPRVYVHNAWQGALTMVNP